MAQYLPTAEVAVECADDHMVMAGRAAQLTLGYTVSVHPFLSVHSAEAGALRSAGAHLIPERSPSGQATGKIREAILTERYAIEFARVNRRPDLSEQVIIEALCEKIATVMSGPVGGPEVVQARG